MERWARNNERKSQQLGMNVSTATHRLVKDILFRFVEAAGHTCYRCGGKMCRDTFSIEHRTPWLNSDNPVDMFFDLDNISFSHKSCNSKAGSKGAARKYTPEEALERVKQSKKKHWTPEKRREHYLKTGN